MSHPQSCLEGASPPRPPLEVADIFRAHANSYRQHHRLIPEQSKAIWDICHCRTATLGGHLDLCNNCGYSVPAYNSCRNRHCPKCQNLPQAVWLEKQQRRILHTHYFHVVLTLPHELNPFAKTNPKKIYNLLFKAASQTLVEFGRSHLNAQIGFTAVLHTWTRQLLLHPHLHCIVTGGGLSQSNNEWVPTSESFLFPIQAMSRLFRGKFLDFLQRAYSKGELDLTNISDKLADPDGFRRLKDTLYRKSWNVYCKPPFGGPEQVFHYLGRYTHRVGVSNRRLIRMDDDGVCFSTKNGKTLTLEPTEFIRRFLLHVLPKRFVKIRHYGLMASANSERLEHARCLIGIDTDAQSPESDSTTEEHKDWRLRLKELTGTDLSVCPRCKLGRMVRLSPALLCFAKIIAFFDTS